MNMIYPRPKQVIMQEGKLVLDEKIVFFEQEMENVFNELKSFTDCKIGDRNESNIIFLFKDLPEQAYELKVSDSNITAYASTEVGFYYAVKTLKQLIRQEMQCLYIYDEPDLKVRGFMFDISRNKVPKLETVKHILDIMSDLKMNHFELYVEGFSFEYKSFKKYLTENSYITVEEYQEIERYANSKYIDFVPNQNGFGHMAQWLELDEFKDLAEAPDGIFLWGRHRAPSTLDPRDERSFELIKKMYADMLPLSNSKYFNMNFDEPFELGKGKSKEAVEKEGLGNVYLDYALKAIEEIRKYNKTPLIWGDVLIRHDDVLDRIPKDVIFVDWGYDANYPFEKHLLKLKETGIKFMAAPGTSSWCSFLGRTYDALSTITSSCFFTKLYGGEGILLTNWGDFGHLQSLPTIYASLVYAGLLSYRCETGTYYLLKHYLNDHIFKDDTKIMGDLILDLANYYRFENYYTSNMTQAFQVFMWAHNMIKENEDLEYLKDKLHDKILSFEKYTIINDFFDFSLRQLKLAKVDELIKEEITYAVNFIKTLYKVNLSLNEEVDESYRIKLLEEVVASKNDLINGLKYLWQQRNKSGGLDKSCEYIHIFIEVAQKLLGGMYGRKNKN
ncbi:MAG TPA: family 20 glycosylhydrolase [Acholeplasmataceae bacterium]|nr:family 20 glycosylhydrolase [Acholeplasmataceae bacterium]